MLAALSNGWNELMTAGPLVLGLVFVPFILFVSILVGMRKANKQDASNLHRGGKALTQLGAALFFGLLFGPNYFLFSVPAVTLIFGWKGLLVSLAIILLISGTVVRFTWIKFKVFAVTYLIATVLLAIFVVHFTFSGALSQ